MQSDDSIMTNSEVFSEDHTVRLLHGRDEQLHRLRACVQPSLRGGKPLHVVIAGPSGSGKTVVARTVLGELSARGVLTAYVNCVEHNTLYAVLESLIADLRILRSERISTPYKLEQLARFIGRRPIVVVLDEIDKILPKERGLVLWHLASLGKLGVICVSAQRHFVESLTDQVRSRLDPTVIEFARYGVEHLDLILRQRIEWGLKANPCDDEVIHALVEGAAGNARVAIQSLRRAAVNAEHRSGSRIELYDVGASWGEASSRHREYLVSLLSEHHRMLLRLVEQRGVLPSTHLFAEYRAECGRLEVQPVARRTFTNYMGRLVLMGLVEIGRADGKGNERVFRTGQVGVARGDGTYEAA